MPRDSRFGPMCHDLIHEHGLIDLFPTDTGERPMGQLYKPAPTPEEVAEKLTEFLGDLFEWFAEHGQPPASRSPYAP